MSTKSIKSNFLFLRCFSLAQNVKQVTFFFLNVLYEHKKHKTSNKRTSNFFFVCLFDVFVFFMLFMLVKFSRKKNKNVLITSTTILLGIFKILNLLISDLFQKGICIDVFMERELYYTRFSRYFTKIIDRV